jgi:hypothetical protein
MKTIPTKEFKRIYKILSMGPHKFVDVLQAMHDYDKFIVKPTDFERHLPWMLWTPNNLPTAWPLMNNQAKFITMISTLNEYHTRGRTD